MIVSTTTFVAYARQETTYILDPNTFTFVGRNYSYAHVLMTTIRVVQLIHIPHIEQLIYPYVQAVRTKASRTLFQKFNE